MASMRIQFRLYEEAPHDAEVLEWIRQLPQDKRGRRFVKEHMVALLAEAIREKSENKPARKVSKRPRAQPKPINGHEKTSAPKSVEQIPTIGDEDKQLPEFPAIKEIRF